MRVAAAVVLALVVLAAAAPAGARGSKPRNPCTVLLPADLETIFEQPWRRGAEQLGGACTWQRPLGVSVPNIVVSLIVEQKKTIKLAKRAYERAEQATRSIVPQVERTKGLGQQGNLTTIISADVLTFRSGRDLVEVRVDRVDRPEEAYHDQILAIGGIVEARLLPPPKTTSTTDKPRRSG